MEKYYLTTPIYYPSGKFHIGPAYTTIFADTTKRYKTLRGYDAYFLTGLDEHGQKIENVAKNNGKTPQQHVDDMAKSTIELWNKMNIEYDDFIRTTYFDPLFESSLGYLMIIIMIFMFAIYVYLLNKIMKVKV